MAPALPPPDLCAVVLAAGGSTRMGQAKALLDLVGAPLVVHHVEALRAVTSRITVVVGGHRDEVRAALPSGVAVVENPHWADTGMADSLALALATLPAQASVLVTPVDVPPAPAWVLHRLVGPGAPAVPSVAGQDAHPVLVRVGPTVGVLASGTLRDALVGARRLEMDWPDGLLNLNTPEAWQTWAAARQSPR